MKSHKYFPSITDAILFSLVRGIFSFSQGIRFDYRAYKENYKTEFGISLNKAAFI